MKKTHVISLLTLLATYTFGQGVVSFEYLPDGTEPYEGMSISTQFLDSHGITFVLEDGSFPKLAKRGSPATAFKIGNNAGDDEIDPGLGMGSFFLTDDGLFSTTQHSLIVNYEDPVMSASGYLLDLDGAPWDSGIFEEWEIQARDSNTNVIETVTLTSEPWPAGDGKTSFWEFNRPVSDISSIKFVYTGNKAPQSNGFAFDNFSPSKSQPVDFELEFCQALLIEWPSIKGLEYQIQWSDRLGGETNGWNNLGEPIIGNGETNVFYKAIRGAQHRLYYRVIISN